MSRCSRCDGGRPHLRGWVSQRLLPAGLLLLASLHLGGAAPALAQTPFALQALGQNLEDGSARDVGRGGWGLADSDTLSPGATNPSALADLRFLGLYFDGFSEATTSRGGGGERLTRRAYLPDIRLAMPLRPGQLVIYTGFDVQRSMRYEMVSPFELDHFGNTVRGEQRYFREGSLFAIPVGLSWRAREGLAFAASLNLVRGAIDEAVQHVFTDPVGNYYLPSIREQEDRLKGTSYSLAMLWDGLEILQFGASVTTGYDLGMERTVNLAGVGDRFYDEFTGAMPPLYSAGLKIQLPRGWVFGADGRLAGYSSFSGRPDWEPQLRDEWTVATGFERPLLFKTHGRGYRLPLRFGYQWRLWAHTVGGASVHEQMVSVGTGFPFRNRLGALDLSLSYVWTGSEADNGWRSNSLRLGVSIAGLERLVF